MAHTSIHPLVNPIFRSSPITERNIPIVVKLVETGKKNYELMIGLYILADGVFIQFSILNY